MKKRPGKRLRTRVQKRRAQRRRELTVKLRAAEQDHVALEIALRRGPHAARAKEAAAAAALAAGAAAGVGAAWVQEHDCYYHWAYAFRFYYRGSSRAPLQRQRRRVAHFPHCSTSLRWR